MVTVALVLVAVLVVLLLVGVVWQMSTSPLWFVYHCCAGSVNGLFAVLGMVFQAIGEAVSGN